MARVILIIFSCLHTHIHTYVRTSVRSSLTASVQTDIQVCIAPRRSFVSQNHIQGGTIHTHLVTSKVLIEESTSLWIW